MSKLLIYGASGYTGRIASHHAKSLGLDFIVAGRTKSTKAKDLAFELCANYRLFDLKAPEDIDIALEGISVLLNCAGPFMLTAEPLMAACIRKGVHYLGIAAELDSYQLAEKKDREARSANVMLLPGCGGSVVMLGCLAGKAVEQVECPASIDISLCISGSISRGSAISAMENMSADVFQRVDGALVHAEIVSTIELDFHDGKGTVANFQTTLPDVITIWKSTGVRNIRTFVHTTSDAFSTGDLPSLADGPTKEEREAAPYHAAVKVTARDGTVTHAVLHTVNGYTFTGLASVEAARKILAGIAVPGFQTPAVIFGNDFVLAIPESKVRML
ncbi:hypothetical protein HBI81_046830 [Parastagonospora nodorum]|nr:hypothetical protein HBH68_230480 [Parastagonospora nodorum]KAH5304567.1 hypothetical protein HBI12_173660 [Parastagonospora nodorum]KAH6318251.1 hypothetical protein HBI39_021520 [Parastagonospora nodorum]KAH6469336.1 hypothetical protein HBI59_052320 [Parastagonospora nodorum]KAH6539195.1 hypothetical protein HBI81_046830 [Parastagonospora nodorum]